MEINPANHPDTAVIARALGPAPLLERIAILVSARWHTAGVRLTEIDKKGYTFAASIYPKAVS